MPTPNGVTSTQAGVSGIGQSLLEMAKGAFKRIADRAKPTMNDVDPGYPKDAAISERIKALVYRYYREGWFEKTQFARKWMRNILMFQGYHELEWSEINVAWEAVLRDDGEYAFPNNYFRSHIMYGVGIYVKNAPEFVFQPTANDFESYAVSNAAKSALEVVKQNVGYNRMRALEAINLRLCGNSFRYSYYSLDSRYGSITSPIIEEQEAVIDSGYWQCPECNAEGEGNPTECDQCGNAELALIPPTKAVVPLVVGQKEFPRGQEMSEAVNPLEVYVRSTSRDLWEAPFLVRARTVDRIVLSSLFPDSIIKGSDESHADLSLIYQQSLADLPGDPTQYAAWYERASSASKTTFLQAWIRPTLYSHDKEMLKQFPSGLYAAVAGETLLDSKDDSLDDHWVHLQYTPVPGRLWADGDDDLVPKQLQLNETDRLILRNTGYNSVPQTFIDSQRIDKNKLVNDPGEVNEVKPSQGKSVGDALHVVPGMSLSPEVHQWRADILTDFEYHSGVFGSAIGQHQPGVDTLGGQQQMANKTEENQSPMILLYQEANERWATQMLKIIAANWLDERVSAVMGVNGSWEFQKLRGAALDMDKVKIEARIIPQDFAQQQAFSQAIAVGALNPQDPRVAKKLLELYQLPTDLDGFSLDAKVQWKEIEKMKAQPGLQIQPVPFVQNNEIHIEICRVWLNSDEAESMPEVAQAVYAHLMLHMQAEMVVQQAAGATGAAGPEAGAAASGAGAESDSPAAESGSPKANKTNRAKKGQAAKPKQSQPSSGNQYGRRPKH